MRKIGYKIRKKEVKNKNSTHSCHDTSVAVLRVQGPCQNIEKTRKLLKQKQSHGTYLIAADGITGACHMTNLLTE